MKVKSNIKKGVKPNMIYGKPVLEYVTRQKVFPYFVTCISPKPDDVKAHMMTYLKIMKKVVDGSTHREFIKGVGFDPKDSWYRKGDPTKYNFEERLTQAYERVDSIQNALTVGTVDNYNDCISLFYADIDPGEIPIAQVDLYDGTKKTTFETLFE